MQVLLVIFGGFGYIGVEEVSISKRDVTVRWNERYLRWYFRIDYYYITIIILLKEIKEPVREPEESNSRNIRNWREKPLQEDVYLDRSL